MSLYWIICIAGVVRAADEDALAHHHAEREEHAGAEARPPDGHRARHRRRRLRRRRAGAATDGRAAHPPAKGPGLLRGEASSILRVFLATTGNIMLLKHKIFLISFGFPEGD